MILIKKIKLHNFLSHKSTEIDFDDNFSISIEGASGSGKSSIIEAILFCLFNEGRGNPRLLIHKGADLTRVTLELKDSDRYYRIERSISAKGKHELKVTEKLGDKFLPVKASGKKNIQEHLEKNIIKSSYLLFINSVLAPQDSIDSFAIQTANKRKEILLEIIKAEDFNEYYKRARELLKDTNESIIESEAKEQFNLQAIEADDNIIKALEHIPKELKKTQESLKTIKTSYNKKAKEANELQSAKKELKAINDKVKELKDKDEDCKSDIDSTKQKLDSLSKETLDKMAEKLKDFDSKRATLKKLKKVKESFDTWREKKATVQNQMPSGRDFDEEERTNETQIAKLDAKETIMCPELDKLCPVFEKEKQGQIGFYKKRLKEIAKDKTDFMNLMSEYQLKVKAIGEEPKIDLLDFRRLSDEVDSLIQIKMDFDKELQASEFLTTELENDKGTLLNLSKQYGEEIEELIENKRKLGNDVVLHDELLEKIKEIGEDIELKEETLSRLLISNDRLENSKKRVDDSNKLLEEIRSDTKELEEKSDGLKMLKDAFGSKGIQDLLIDWSLPQLEDKINEALEQTSEFRVVLSTQKANVSGTSTKDGLWIMVINEESEEMDFCNYSGGERVKIKAAISSGLASLSRIAFRIYDEMFVALDSDSTESFVDVVTSMKENVKQLLVVSHLDAVKDVFLDKIKVTKNNGISSVKK